MQYTIYQKKTKWEVIELWGKWKKKKIRQKCK